MKLILFLTNATVILCLLIYDHHSFNSVSEMVTKTHKISQQIDEFGELRHELMQHQSNMKTEHALAKEKINAFGKSHFFESNNSDFINDQSISNWPNLLEFNEKSNSLKKGKITILRHRLNKC